METLLEVGVVLCHIHIRLDIPESQRLANYGYLRYRHGGSIMRGMDTLSHWFHHLGN